MINDLENKSLYNEVGGGGRSYLSCEWEEVENHKGEHKSSYQRTTLESSTMKNEAVILKIARV